MNTYVSMLRGINVSGKNKIPMKDLAELYRSLGFTFVATYIQSGNVVFATDEITTASEKAIEKAILETFGFEVPVILRTAGEMQEVIATNPFIHEPDIDEKKLHVTFLEDEPEQENIIPSEAFLPDRFVLHSKEVYLYCPGGYGVTKLTNTFFEKKLHTRATTRNWQTVNTLAGMALKA